MNKKRATILVGCSILCLGILAVLYASSPISKDIPRGGFHRSMLERSAAAIRSAIDLGDRDHYIAGTSPSTIYVADYNHPFRMLTLDTNLENKIEHPIRIDLDSVKDPKRFILAVDSPNFYMANSAMPTILQGSVSTWHARVFSPSMEYFDGAAAISPSNFAVRAYSRSNSGYELAKKSGQDPFVFHYDLLQKQLDGTFCLDGELRYNKDLNSLVYLHFYRNEFVVADSNMTLRYRGHTIDTISKAKIKVAMIDGGQTSMLAAPPLRVNVTYSMYKKWMVVASNMLSDNEDMHEFKNNIILDVYNLEDGTYHHSFYLPKYKNYGISGFQIFKDYLVAMYDKYLVIYQIDSLIFEKSKASENA